MRKLVAILALSIILYLTTSPAIGADSDYVIASILRGEAPHDCRKCRELTACALVRDSDNGVSLRGRWYGWWNARAQDVELVQWARESSNCDIYPTCRFVGNGRDLEVWARKGWIPRDVRSIAYCSWAGCTVCVPEEVGPYISE